MKLLLAIAAALAITTAASAAETKRVCVEVIEKGKTVEKCRTVKVHKKHEGTPVPEKAPAKRPAAKPDPKK